jgi:medium-chain acyl-[acyl-carrier-protein] hydrolase
MLPDWIDVATICLPGRGARFDEPAATDLGALVSDITGAIALMDARPKVLFGHSLGALLAYEVARLLRQRDAEPALLFVSGRQAPGLPSRRNPIAHLSGDRFVAELKAIGGTPAEILESDELISLLLPMLKADFALAEEYASPPGPPLDCPVVALGGSIDPWVNADDLRAWSGVTNGPFSVRMFPGDHFYLHEPERLIAYVHAILASRYALPSAQ